MWDSALTYETQPLIIIIIIIIKKKKKRKKSDAVADNIIFH
jgi:hypothetical protein